MAKKAHDDFEESELPKKKPIQISEKPANEIRYKNNRFNPNDDLIAAMYAMYTTPDPDTGQQRSLQHIARVYKRHRQYIYTVFKERGYKLRSKPMRNLQTFKGVNFSIHQIGNAQYLRGTFKGKRIYMHRYVWLVLRGKIPKGYYVLHKDGNYLNNNIKNLYIQKRKSKKKPYGKPK